MAIPLLLRSVLASAFAPLLIFALVAGAVRVFGWRSRRLPWAGLSGLVTAAMALLALAYLFLPVLFEDAETDIACVSALAMRGLPIYPAMDAIPRYILLYGPLTYLAHIPFYAIFGKNLVAFKLLGVLAFAGTLAGIYRLCRHYAEARPALIGLGCAALVFLRYAGIEFWGRIDPLILVMTVLSIWATVEGPLWAVILVNSLAIAVIPNLKISGFAYLLPGMALLIPGRGWRIALSAAFLGAAALPVPFLLPQVSITNYAAVLKAAAGHGLVWNFLLRNVQYSILLLLPAAAIFHWRQSTFGQRLYLGAIAMGLAITSVLGSKSGAGSYHLLPYVAPIVHLYFWRRSELPPEFRDTGFSKLAIAWTVTTLFLASTHVQTLIREFRTASIGRHATAEILGEEDLFRGRTLEVGPGKDFEDPRTRYAYLPVFRGQPYTIAGAAIRDLQMGGAPIPDATVHYLESCGTQVWLIPRGDAPFSAPNSYYDTPHPAFEASFRQAFTSRYRRARSGELYDVWVCGE